MWERVQPAAVVFIVLGGLFSGIVCQAHMVAELGAGSSHHASHEEAHEQGRGMPSHQAAHHEGSTPEDPCCIVQLADSKAQNPIVLLPDAIVMTVAETVEEPAPRLSDRATVLILGPPGSCSVLDQSCVLLI